MKNLALSLLLISACVGCGTSEYSIEELDYGIGRADIIDTVRTEHLPDGYRNRSESIMTVIKKTDTIPTTLGVQFGVSYKVISKNSGKKKVRITWFFPDGMKDDKGKVLKDVYYDASKTLNEYTYSNYILEKPSELVKGPWTVQLSVDGKTIYKRTFILI